MLLSRLKYLVMDPPPLLVFEITDRTVSGVRRNAKNFDVEAVSSRELPEGVLDPSPARPNVIKPDLLEQTIRSILDELGAVRRPDVALILPDSSARLTVLDFDQLPRDQKERMRLIRWRLKKTVPFDADQASIACQVWPAGGRVAALVAVTPLEVVRQYEAPFENAGLWPGFVSLSMAETLNLLPSGEMTLLAKRSGRSLSMAAVEKGIVKMVRWVELTTGQGAAADSWADAAGDLYPTMMYVNDSLGVPVAKLVVCGFDLSAGEAERIPAEFGCAVEPLRTPRGHASSQDAGIWGYLSVH